MSRWTLVQPEDTSAVFALREALGVSPTVAHLLVLRGIRTFEQARAFFRPDLSQLHDPFLMKDMEIAASRLAEAIRKQETVVVYGDYDVDGATATSMMYLFLRKFGVNAHYYIPHRFKDGYGISIDGITYAKEQGSHLIVSVDCGITAIHEAKFARLMGIDLIICDHHNPGEEIPDALAVLNPKRHDCPYPFDGLSGAGVGFKLIQATILKLGLPMEIAYSYLDLLAISIASDIVPIIDENRILMREGLERLNSNPRIGVAELAKLIHIEIGKVTASKIVFSIGPRINAAGRMGDATTAVRLLIAETQEEALQSAKELERINNERRLKDRETMDQAVGLIEAEPNLETRATVILHQKDWHLGVIGIVASRIVDRYSRPAIMLSSVEGLVKGSARSVRGFNVFDALRRCNDLLLQFGGHEFAAGLTLQEENLEAFRTRFNEIAEVEFRPDAYEPEFMIDAELNLSEIGRYENKSWSTKFWPQLRQFEPHGPNNHLPVFQTRNLRLVGQPSIFGDGHLKFRVKQPDSDVFEAIGFKMQHQLPVLLENRETDLSLVYTLEEKSWNEVVTVQLRVKDIRMEQAVAESIVKDGISQKNAVA